MRAISSDDDYDKGREGHGTRFGADPRLCQSTPTALPYGGGDDEQQILQLHRSAFKSTFIPFTLFIPLRTLARD